MCCSAVKYDLVLTTTCQQTLTFVWLTCKVCQFQTNYVDVVLVTLYFVYLSNNICI